MTKKFYTITATVAVFALFWHWNDSRSSLLDESGESDISMALDKHQKTQKKKRVFKRNSSDSGKGSDLTEFLELQPLNLSDLQAYLDARDREKVDTFLSNFGSRSSSGQTWRDLVTFYFSNHDDPLLRHLPLYVGREQTPDSIRECLGLFGDKDYDLALIGYCGTLASNGDSLTISEFMSLRKVSSDPSALGKVLRNLPPTADFPSLASQIPSDKFVYASSARDGLVEAWARSDPEDSLNYVLTSNSVSKDQITTVISVIADQNLRKAEKMVGQIENSDQRHYGELGVLSILARYDGSAAWERALKMNNFRKSEQALMKVNEIWKRSNPDEARVAWSDYLARKRNMDDRGGGEQ